MHLPTFLIGTLDVIVVVTIRTSCISRRRYTGYIVQNNHGGLRIFMLANLEKPHIGSASGGLTTALTIAATHWRPFAGEYFTRVVKVTNRTELQSVYGFELHRTVSREKLCTAKPERMTRSVDPILTRTTLLWMNSMRSKVCTRG